MTDYLFSVKKLVDRLDLETSNGPSSYKSSRKKTRSKVSINSVSGSRMTGNGNSADVQYRNKNAGNDTCSKRKISRPKTEILNPHNHRQSLYQIIKVNKEKLSGKNGGESFLKSPEMTSSNFQVSSPLDNKNTTIFKFNIHDSCEAEKCDKDSSSSAFYREQKSRVSEKMNSAMFLSPCSQFAAKPKSPDRLISGEDYSLGNDKITLTEAQLRSQTHCDTVFLEREDKNINRENTVSSRQRVSLSKSVPLSPPSSNPERSAQQFSNFQLKLDTLRAELLAMRKADQELAKKLLGLYSEIQILKVKNSCMNYSELIDEAMYEAEIADEFPDMCDAPRKFTNKLLTSHGVTSFNIHSRRFSCS